MDYRLSMESSETLRNKCGGCYRQFNKKEHLVEHMRISYHSVHEPICGICNKHCRSFDSLREHLIGPLPKQECKNIFSICGCRFCLTILESPNARRIHQERCQFSNVNSGLTSRMAALGLRDNAIIDYTSSRSPRVVALSCKMVGGGSDGSLDLCARVCITDESENVVFHTYVKPTMPVTNYRYQTTGIRPENLRDAMPLKHAQRKIQEFLCNGEPMWKIRPRNGKARILVGHGLDNHLDSLQLEYSSSMIRDTAEYPPLMKSSKLSNSLKYLTQAYLGYDIHVGIQDPYEDCVAAMRLYTRMRYQKHRIEAYPLASDPQNRNNYGAWRQNELERMSPEELLDLSRSDYYCWCLDSVS
ncbi:PREDICTED: apoptosis-enhancing nuclease-like [Camelina sativa]|uniref:RNA exonuclease 4 n=1 Tax=Camelina sativa TaxID=90675 RepID=A0ABM0U517_CAMSA|nr:PREDICTED: apoptosis-enhancing nuclease-like [Camelina sativa]